MAGDDAVAGGHIGPLDLGVIGSGLKRCYRATDDDGAFNDLLARLDGVGVEREVEVLPHDRDGDYIGSAVNRSL